VTRERKIAPTFTGRDAEWIKSDWYCMECGQQDVWQVIGSGSDYYHDHEAQCHSCRALMCCVNEVTEREP